MTATGLALMAVGLVLFGVGFRYHVDSRARARINVATILACYVGLMLALTPQLLESSAP